MIKAILFDLDGTLLSMNVKQYVTLYTESLSAKFATKGFDPKLIAKVVMDSIKITLTNDGSKTNEEVFWSVFEKETKIKKDSIIHLVKEYYDHEFNITKKACNKFNESKLIIDYLKTKDYKLILATNPLFPKEATYKRVEWAGLHYTDFDYITTYENSSFTKPNPLYFKEILDKLNLKINEVIMIGNNLIEDGAITKLNGKFAIITNEMENKDTTIENYIFKGNLNEFYSYIKENY